MEKIRYLFGTLQVQIKHIYREANGIADFFGILCCSNIHYLIFWHPLLCKLNTYITSFLLPTARLKRVVNRGNYLFNDSSWWSVELRKCSSKYRRIFNCFAVTEFWEVLGCNSFFCFLLK